VSAEMRPECGRRFGEELLSGYLDGVLPQGDRQRVELHLADCAACRGLVDQLGGMRLAARGTAFLVPTDEQWRELPRSVPSRALRLGGWTLLLAWVALMAGVAAVEVLRSGMPAWGRLALLGGAGAFLLLLLSVLLDRLHDLKTDRYTQVHK
jgi:anti-sigma factor RsiW